MGLLDRFSGPPSKDKFAKLAMDVFAVLVRTASFSTTENNSCCVSMARIARSSLWATHTPSIARRRGNPARKSFNGLFAGGSFP